MPASSGDPIGAAVTHSLTSSTKFSSEGDSLDTKLIGSAKRVLMTEIKYEQTSSFSSNMLDLKSKYIVLKPPTTLENGELKLKNGVPKATNDLKVSTSIASTSKGSNIASKLPSPGIVSNKSDAVLPSPKRVLFPPEKIQLGWQSKTVPVGSGMVNMGNTCYLNSTLQALFHVPAFVNWLLNDKVHKEKCETTNGLTPTDCLICAMLKTLRNSMENSASSNPIRPHFVYSKLKLICKRLIHGHQEDAHEFLRYLIESMDRSYLRIMQANNLDSYSKETTPLSQIFGGYLRTEVRCLECRHISLTFQHFQDLLLDIRQSNTMEEALEAYFSRERLGDGEEAYKCDKCHRRVAATKQFTVEKPPNVLCIQLKRFGIMGGKNSKHIQVQQNLDLTRFWVHRSSNPSQRYNYRLVSLVSHIGPSSNCGHYTAIGLTCSGQFYLFDDSMVRAVSSQNISGNNTYIIMYELTSPSPTLNATPSKTVLGNCTVTKPSGVNGTNPFSKCSSSSLTNGTSFSPNKTNQHSTPLKSMLNSPSKQTSSSCTKNGVGPSPASSQALASLVPYSAESSDSDTEPSASAKHTHTPSQSQSPLKNGFAKESSSVKYSNCASAGEAASTFVSGENGVVLVNGWKVTEVARRSASDALYSPPQNWDVVETSTKNGEKNEESSHSKTTLFNGVNGKDTHRKPVENGHSNHNGDSAHEEQPTKKLTNGVTENGRISNGKSWDGNRNNGAVDYLRRNSHQGYGANVTTWNGNRTQVDREAETERIMQRKRSYDHMYEDEFDQGKVKKIKPHNHYHKNGDREMNGRRNFFQEQQNHKNNGWYGDRKPFYRTYGNNHYRTYQNNRNQSNYHWRR